MKQQENGQVLHEVVGDDPNNGLHRKYWPDGKLRTQFSVLDGEVQGSALAWYENGQLKTSIPYRNGVVHGPIVQWYDTGEMSFVIQVREGKRNGAFSEWYPHAGLRRTGIHKDGERHGPWFYFDPSGNKRLEERWELGTCVHRGPDIDSLELEIDEELSSLLGLQSKLEQSGEFVVEFVKSGVKATWTPESVCLLSLAEANGVPIESACCAGIDAICRTRLLSGTVAYPEEPSCLEDIDEDECVPCLAVPTSSIRLDV